jgi:hypothetical protein
MVTMTSGAGCGLLLAFSSSRPLPTLALTASMASASLTVEQFEFLGGCLLLLFLLAAVHLAVPVSRFEYDKEEALAVRGVRRVPSSGRLGGRQSQQRRQTREVRSNSIVNPQEHNEQQQQQQQQQIICPSPPAIIRQGPTSGFIGDCGADNTAAAAAAAAADIPRDETKESSSIGGTEAATIIRRQGELLNDRALSIGEEEEMEVEVEMTTQNEEERDGEVGGELVLGGDEDSAARVEEELEGREGKDETEWRDDAIDLDDITEGRDDYQDGDSSNSVTAEDSIEVRPNEKRSVLALVSEGVIDRVQSSNQRRALFLLDVRGVPYEKVDGMDPAQREVRDDLFELAGFGGDGGKPVSYTYPQFFFVGDGTVSYVGDFERLLSLNDASDIPGDILDQNPDLETWERVFVNLVDPSEIASP